MNTSIRPIYKDRPFFNAHISEKVRDDNLNMAMRQVHTIEIDRWIRENHYLHSTPAGAIIRMEFLNEHGKRIGAMMWGRPISPQVDQKHILELTRMFFVPNTEHCIESKALAMARKATIDTRTRGLTRGRQGSSSENFQNAGRELMTPDEVRALDNKYALLFIRGEAPVMDVKYDILKHPNVKWTEDGGGAGCVPGSV